MRNALTVDVEDWYMTSDFSFPVTEWHRYEDRVLQNTKRLLKLFARYDTKGTFFILGCIAEKFPSLVEEIVREGHEIGSHGGWHRMLTSMPPEEFRQDIRYSKCILEKISGHKVTLFRAPSWSVTPGNFGMLKILQEEGFTCDSSMQPFRTPLSGISGAPAYPFHPVIDGEELSLVEYPPTVLKAAGITVPFSGGLYLRTMPYPLISLALRKVNRIRPGMVYVHPWEVDPDQPRLKAGLLVRLAHYHNLETTERKLERLLARFEFVPLGEIIRAGSFPRVALQVKRRG